MTDDVEAVVPSVASRDARLISLGTLGSRITGLARVVVASAVLGTGALGGLYETANRIPNLLFNLFAGGALHAVLVPAFVRARQHGGDADVRRLADAVSAALTMFLGVVVLTAMAASPLVIRALTAAEPDAALRQDKVSLGTSFMLIFVPQVLCYGVAVVSSAALAARDRFVAAAAAPAVNNVLAIGVYVIFWVMRDGKPPTLDLSALELAVLAGGTTLAVVGFAAVPVWLAVRAGMMGWPRRGRGEARAAGLYRSGSWAVVQVAGTIAVTITAVVLGNATENGVGVFLWAQNFLWLPVGLVAAPLATALAPRLVRARDAGDAGSGAGRRESEGAITLAVAALSLCGALMMGLGWPTARLVAFGEAVRDGYAPLAHTMIAFGAGLVGTGTVFLLTRMLFSVDDTRGAAVCTMVLAAAGVVAMGVASDISQPSDRGAALAYGFGIAHLVGAAMMLVRYARRTGWVRVRSLARPSFGAVVAGAGAAVGAWAVGSQFPSTRGGAAVSVILGAATGLAAFSLLMRVVGGKSLRRLVQWEV